MFSSNTAHYDSAHRNRMKSQSKPNRRVGNCHARLQIARRACIRRRNSSSVAFGILRKFNCPVTKETDSRRLEMPMEAGSVRAVAISSRVDKYLYAPPYIYMNVYIYIYLCDTHADSVETYFISMVKYAILPLAFSLLVITFSSFLLFVSIVPPLPFRAIEVKSIRESNAVDLESDATRR